MAQIAVALYQAVHERKKLTHILLAEVATCFAGGNLTGYNAGVQSCEIIAMPTISMFYGILISMYVLDTEKHHLPHIHVRYNEFNASIGIPLGEVLEGSIPSRQMKLVQAWIELHQDDLMADWFLAASGQTPFKIDPLR